MIDNNPFSKKISMNKFQILIIFLLLISILFAVFLHAYFGYFSRYIADDYCLAGKAKMFGYFNSQVYWRNNWDGHFTSDLFTTLFILLGNRFITFLPTISILLLLISSFYFIKQLLDKLLSASKWYFTLIFSVLFVFLLIYTTPQIVEDFYWMQGLTSYQFPIIF